MEENPYRSPLEECEAAQAATERHGWMIGGVCGLLGIILLYWSLR